MRVRLRDYPGGAELARMYATPHDHTRWDDHVLRVEMSIALCRPVVRTGWTIADLSAGSGAIANTLASQRGARTVLGDLAPGWELCGPIEDTLAELDRADLFILSETLEHLADPDSVVRKIRGKTEWLFISTPFREGLEPMPIGGTNPEHVWGWDATEVDQMLLTAGFTPQYYALIDPRRAGYQYAYQMWLAR